MIDKEKKDKKQYIKEKRENEKQGQKVVHKNIS